MDFMAGIIANPYQFWLILGGLLLALEVLTNVGIALWSGISAIIVALLVILIPVSWQGQWIIFSALALAVVILWWKYSQSKTQKRRSSSLLNRPYLSLIGTRCTLIEPIIDGYGRVKLADSSWRVKSHQNLPQGTTVIVEALEGNTLVVKEFK